MCGIVGYTGPREAAPVLIDGLRRLEYRGYDSAGVAILNGKILSVHRAEGKLCNLENKISSFIAMGHTGIGHTRWATHGKPSEVNAHPHCSERVILVHNGIIENYEELKALLPKKGRELKSETDTEVACHLLDANLKKNGGSFLEAFRETLSMLKGSYAFVAMDTLNRDRLYTAKLGSPLVIGLGEKENFVASDVPALLPYTRNVIFLEDGEMAEITTDQVTVYNRSRKVMKKVPREISWTAEMAEKGGYKHFMLKEIMEQPRAVHDTLSGHIDSVKKTIVMKEIAHLFEKKKFPSFNRFYMVACGTSWHSAMAGRYLMEAIAKIPVSVDTASEFRYREPFIDKKTLLLVISQSGETADTLACVQDAKKKGATVISICNVIDASIPRISDGTLYTKAGPEIGVASTKAFTTQLALLLLLALYFGKLNKCLSKTYFVNAIRALNRLPDLMSQLLSYPESIAKIAETYAGSRDIYYIARGVHYPIALEGALKLKEISYIHAEGYAAGEMKHGPIAMIEPGTPLVALAPSDRVCEKMISNIQEVRARGASVFVVATEGDKNFEKGYDHIVYVPKSVWYLTPILVSLPLQLFAYYVADFKGTDVDQPRNLAKSVTVE